MLFTAEDFIRADGEQRRQRIREQFARRSLMSRLRQPTQVAVPPPLPPAGEPVIVAERARAEEYVSV